MTRTSSRISPASSQFVSAASLRVRSVWFNQLRWGVVAGLAVAIPVADFWLESTLPMGPMLMVCGLLALLNGAYTLRNRRVEPVRVRSELRLIKLQMFCDLLALTALLNLSGGIDNPFLFAYVIHVIIASLLFKGPEIFKIALLAIALFTTMVIGEHLGLLPSHPIWHDAAPRHAWPYLLLTLSAFWLVLLFAAYIGALIMKHNRTIKDELVQRQKDLVAADRAQVDFFRFVTHEVKNPVTTAQSAVEAAQDIGGEDLPLPVDDLLARASGRLDQATRIVKDLADLTRSDLLKHERPHEMDLSRFVLDVADMQRELAQRRGQSIVTQLPDDPVILVTSSFMVDKIITNLIGNAVRYNRDGGLVEVTLSREKGQVRLVVQDQGIGIAPEDQERIFEEFYRSRPAQDLSNLGTGLGLSIALKFARALGGEITLSSELGQGATFVCELPFPTAGWGGQ